MPSLANSRLCSVLQAPSNLKSGLTNSKGFLRLYTATGASQKQSLDRHLQAAADGGPFQELNYWTRANDSILCISSQYAALTTKLGGRATYIAFRLLIQIQVPIRLKINSAIAFISLALMSHWHSITTWMIASCGCLSVIAVRRVNQA